MVVMLGVHRANQADVVDDCSQVWKCLANSMPLCPCLRNWNGLASSTLVLLG